MSGVLQVGPIKIFPLYSTLPPQQQQKIFDPVSQLESLSCALCSLVSDFHIDHTMFLVSSDLAQLQNVALVSVCHTINSAQNHVQCNLGIFEAVH